MEEKNHTTGWFDSEKVKPPTKRYYDLLKLRDSMGKIRSGWWTGVVFDGLRVDELEDISYWKYDRNAVFD